MSFDFLQNINDVKHDLVKPTRLSRDLAKYQRTLARNRERRATQRAEREAWLKVRADVYARDGGICRALGIRLKLRADDPMLIAGTHHLLFRSLGGSDELSNLILISPAAHDLIHRHELSAEGDGNGLVEFIKKNPETGRIIERWASTPRGRAR